MSCMVPDLQKNSMDGKYLASNLLRQALVIATKLEVYDIVDWVKNEMNGYSSMAPENLPPYRQCKAILQGYDPYFGWKPIIFTDLQIENTILQRGIYQSIAEIEELISSNLPWLTCQLNGPQELEVNGLIQANVQIRMLIPRVSLHKTCEGIRNFIFEWALELEKKGIKGENMVFSNDKTQQGQYVHINIEQMNGGIIGDVNNSTVSTNTTNTKNCLESLEKLLLLQGITQEDIKNLEEALEEDPHPGKAGIFGKKVSAWIGDIVNKAASGFLSIGADMAGLIMTKSLNAYYGF